MNDIIKNESLKCKEYLISLGYNVEGLDYIDILEKYYEIMSQKETE